MNPCNPQRRIGLYAACVRDLARRVLQFGALLTAPAVLAVNLTTGPNFPPLSDQSKADGGIATRIITATFQSMGEAVTLDWLPWKRGFEETKAGRYHGTYPYVRSPERELDFWYSDAIFTNQSFLWTRTGDTLSAQDPSTFKSQRVLCVPHGYLSPMEDVLRTQIASGEVRVERPVTREGCIRMLVSKRVDATTGSEGEIGASLVATGLGAQISRGDKPIVELEYFLIAPKSDPQSAAMVKRFNSQLRKLKADGRYRRLVDE